VINEALRTFAELLQLILDQSLALFEILSRSRMQTTRDLSPSGQRRNAISTCD